MGGRLRGGQAAWGAGCVGGRLAGTPDAKSNVQWSKELLAMFTDQFMLKLYVMLPWYLKCTGGSIAVKCQKSMGTLQCM